jgi:MFS family permease
MSMFRGPSSARIQQIDQIDQKNRPRGEVRLGATAAIALAAASTGVVVPALKSLVEDTGHGPVSAGLFMAAHVLGGVIAALWGAHALRTAGSARRLAVVALAASIAVTLAMAAIEPLELRIVLRFADGACHLLAITALVAAATAGDAALRTRRAVAMGLAIVLGIAGGLGVGAVLGHPRVALVVAALLSGASLITVVAHVAAEPLLVVPPGAAPSVSPGVSNDRRRGPIAPGLLAFGERFIFGTLTVATPFLAEPARVGAVLGVFMVTSVIALGAARRYAVTWGPRKLAVRSTLAFALALAAAAVLDVFASLWIALPWAIVGGGAAGALYASALVLAARSAALEDRMRDMATVNAAGSAGHALGALCAGLLVGVLPGTLVIALPGVAIIAAATIGVWITVPAAARDCPVVGGLAKLADGEPAPADARQQVS